MNFLAPCIIFLFGFMLSCVPLQAEETSCPSTIDWMTTPLDSMDGATLEGCSYHDLILLMGVGEVMMEDTSIERQIKGDICFGMISDELKVRSEQAGFDGKDPALQFLTQALRRNKYYLDLERPSDWEKLWHYMEEGRWEYIGRRFVDRNMHYYALGGLGTLLVLGLWWRKKKKQELPES